MNSTDCNKSGNRRRFPRYGALTPREREVFSWLCAGKTNPEIAIIMGISPWTVKIHVANIYKKLDVSSRAQAMVRAVAMKMVDVR